MIKKMMTFLFFLLLSSPIWAEYGKFGIGADVYLYNVKDVNINDVKVKNNAFSINPTFSWMFNEKLEILPSIIVGLTTEKTDNTVTEQYMTLGLGGGVLWHFVRKDFFRFATGLSTSLDFTWALEDPAYVQDFAVSWHIELPLVFELVPTEFLSIRATLNILSFNLVGRTYDYGSGAQKRYTTTFESISDLSKLGIGLYYRFN